jgi:flagellin
VVADRTTDGPDRDPLKEEETFMSLRINQNIAAQNAYRNLSVTDGQMAKSLEKLSSGFRINRAADDAAGLAISEGLRSQVGGLKVAVRNAQDGVSVAQTAEGALTEVHSMLQRMNDLAVQYASGSQNTESKAALNTEFTALQSEIARIGTSTKFNGTALFTAAGVDFQVGTGNADKISVTVGVIPASVAAAFITSSDLVQTAVKDVSAQRANLGAVQNRFEQLAERRGREPVRVGEPHPRHRHGGGDGVVHAVPDPVPGRHRDAGAGQPGAPGRSVAPALNTAQFDPLNKRPNRRAVGDIAGRPLRAPPRKGSPTDGHEHRRPRQRHEHHHHGLAAHAA